MEKPTVGATLVFVKLFREQPWYTTFCLHWDGSCGFFFPTERSTSMCMGLGPGWNILYAKFRCNPNGWRRAFQQLSEMEFVSLAEAQRRGWLPEDWLIPAHPSHT